MKTSTWTDSSLQGMGMSPTSIPIMPVLVRVLVLALIGRLSNHHLGLSQSSYRISRRLLRRQHAVAQPCYVMRAACVSAAPIQRHSPASGPNGRTGHRSLYGDGCGITKYSMHGRISTHVRCPYMLLGMIDRRPRSSSWPFRPSLCVIFETLLLHDQFRRELALRGLLLTFQQYVQT